jgi:hypothetical protein
MMTLRDFVPPLARLIGLFGQTEHKAAASALRSQLKSIVPLYPYIDPSVRAAGASPHKRFYEKVVKVKADVAALLE